ncbi:DUF6531 domain-containing protein [Pseudomonas tohonis]|uniref:DUF6531 domain-containing protein n=1 Tax=Pseudomonas tohonis TaxID=2725477 RepID=UPI0021DAEB2F|nr:DUF6531 domain-containing protein [Pseudomonas tohonis]UXY55136.1 DUF6531 domain-containing protein [Pseudomonas tohonis]
MPNLPPMWGVTAYREGDSCNTGTKLIEKIGICQPEPPASIGQPCPNQAPDSIRQPDGSCRPLISSPTQKGEPTPLACAGNPIDLSTGNKYQPETDLSLPDFDFKRFYNSIDGDWSNSFSTNIQVEGRLIILTLDNGQERYFTHQENDSISANQFSAGSLSRNASGWIYRSENKKSYRYDDQGRLSSIEDPKYKKLLINYSGNELSVHDDQSQLLKLTFVHQKIKTAQNESTLITYTYDEDLRLIKTTKVERGIALERQYHYEDARNPNLLTGITDERGIRYATWAYDDQGRAISSEHAGGAERTLVSYNADGSSTVTNALGKRTTYRFQTIQGVRRITAIEGEPSANCPNSNSTFTYDDRGLVKTRTDNKGNVTTFDYNDRGLEVSRTEAFGTPQARTVTTEWHPTLFLPTTITEPDRTSRYSYDVQGRLIEQATTQR